MKAEIISVGNEILLGEIADTNSSYLAAQLPLLGIDLHWVTQVGDDRLRLVDAFRRALSRSDLILATGGLGPTVDDMTREAIAETFGEESQVDPALEAGLLDMFAKWGRKMPSHNLKQAAIIPSAQAVPNHRGTAPGWWVERDGKVIVAMPGPPGEMKQMWQEEITPRLTRRLSGQIILCRSLKTIGLTEATVDEMAGPVIACSDTDIGIYAKPDGIHLRIVVRGDELSEIEAKLLRTETSLREILGKHIWGVDDDTLAGVIGKLLMERGRTLATMESYTDGVLAAALGEAQDSFKYYKGGFVVGSEEMLATLGVEAGPTEGAALSMADASRSKLDADIGLGIAGPRGQQDQAFTVFIVVSDAVSKRTHKMLLPPWRIESRQWVTMAALFELRQLLLDSR